MRGDPLRQCNDLRREVIWQLEVMSSNPVRIDFSGVAELDDGWLVYIGVDNVLFPGHNGWLGQELDRVHFPLWGLQENQFRWVADPNRACRCDQRSQIRPTRQ